MSDLSDASINAIRVRGKNKEENKIMPATYNTSRTIPMLIQAIAAFLWRARGVTELCARVVDASCAVTDDDCALCLCALLTSEDT